jgi:dynein heavy chain
VIPNLDQAPELKYYIESENRKVLTETLQNKLEDYNFDSQNKMDLVFFEDAVKYITKITRILMQPRGNAMLLGVAGCGK